MDNMANASSKASECLCSLRKLSSSDVSVLLRCRAPLSDEQRKEIQAVHHTVSFNQLLGGVRCV